MKLALSLSALGKRGDARAVEAELLHIHTFLSDEPPSSDPSSSRPDLGSGAPHPCPPPVRRRTITRNKRHWRPREVEKLQDGPHK